MINHNSSSKKAMRKKGRIDFKNWNYDIHKMRMVPLIEQRPFIEKAKSVFFGNGGMITKIEFGELSEDNKTDHKAIQDFLFDPGHQIARNYPEDYFG